MSDRIHAPPSANISSTRKQLAPDIHDLFQAFSRAVFADGALPKKSKQLIAVAHVTQCPWGHTKAALRSGATREEIMETIWVAAEMRAGGAYAHSAVAIEEMEQNHASAARNESVQS